MPSVMSKFQVRRAVFDQAISQRIIRLLLQQVTESTPKSLTYVNSEFDSNQSTFEFINNNIDLVVKANSKAEAAILLWLERMIIDDIFARATGSDDLILFDYLKQLQLNFDERGYRECPRRDFGQLKLKHIDKFLAWLKRPEEFTFNDQLIEVIAWLILHCGPGEVTTDLSPQQVDRYSAKYQLKVRQIKAVLCQQGKTIDKFSLTHYFFD